ncbi:MAG TPA: hypothetical protein PLL67_05340 [Gammaproteobacteria bacterium]|nr:hypothetical protein [Gammaproteobacteria bacterium]
MMTIPVKKSETMVSQPCAQHPNPLTFLYSNLASALPGSIIGLIQEYYASPKEIAEFLKCVVEGEQDQAEAMVKRNPDLALVPGDVTDLSKRTFTNITGFQYALWALDWHMWTMIIKYLPDEEVKNQIEELETGTWVENNGVSARGILDKLMKAYRRTISFCYASKYVESNKVWLEEVGGAQLLLPVHVINEYCHPLRSFSPLPNFNDDLLPRGRIIQEGEWFSALYAGGTLGEKFAIQRAGGSNSGCTSVIACSGRFGKYNASLLHLDLNAVQALANIRTAQHDTLITEYTPKHIEKDTNSKAASF